MQQGGGFEEFAHRAGRGDARLGEQRLSGHGPGRGGRGVRGGGTATGLGTARVDRQNGHPAGHPPGGAGERPRVAEGLQVQQGQVGATVALPPLEHVIAADVVLVAERHEGRDTDAEPGQPVEQGDAHAARLYGDTRRAGARVVGREGGVEAEPRVGVGDAEAVGADQTHAVGTARGHERLRLVGVEPGRHHEQRPYAGFAALFGRGGQGVRGYGEDREIRDLGQRADRRIRRHTEDRGDVGFTAKSRRVKPPRADGAGEPAPPIRACVRRRPRRPRRAQQRFQAGHVGGPATGLDGREIGVVLVERDGATPPDPRTGVRRAGPGR